MAPLDPIAEFPVAKNKDPLSPRLAVPVLNEIEPLPPFAPAFEVINNNDPLDVSLLSPVLNEILPPAELSEAPADRLIPPPVPLLPEPTDTCIGPPLPDREVPEPSKIPPLFKNAVPVLRIRKPLDPETPPFEEIIDKLPLVVDSPSPLRKRKFPPVENEDAPDDITTSPPAPLFPLPTRRRIAPAEPDRAVWVSRRIEPLFPELDVPV